MITALIVILTAAGITGYLLRPHPPTPTAAVASQQPSAAAPAPQQTVLPFTGLNMPEGVAVDTAGAVYVVDLGNRRVRKLAAGSSTPADLPFTGINPIGVAVDAAGNVYVANYGNSVVVKLAAGSSTQTELLGYRTANIGFPGGVAVDTAGNVYISDTRSRVLELWASPAPRPTCL